MNPMWVYSLTALILLATLLMVGPAVILTGNAGRLRIRRWLRRHLKRRARQTLRTFNARIDRFKFTQKSAVRERLLRDAILSKAVASDAAQHEDPDVGVDVDGSWERAEDYLEEIVPAFNILSYFHVGYATARLVLGSLYRADVDPADMERLQPWLKDRNKSLIFLINHRSNADFVLLALALAHRVALSYAVGEWARVWPLEPLFKSFGSYFVRRGERDPLYHAVLARYVQSVCMEGVTQGVFLEGGLSRDGALRPPKTGLLDSLILAKNDPSFTKELWLIPTAISFDRVLEDESLIMEARGQRPERWQRRKMLRKQARNVFTYLFSQSTLWLMERHRRFGHAAVRVGEPINVDAWLKEHPGWLTADRNARKNPLMDLAHGVMASIARNVAILPVPLLCRILHDRMALPEAEARALFESSAADLRSRGARLWTPRPRLKDPFRLAVKILLSRGLLKSVEGALVVTEAGRPLVEYYARGLEAWLPLAPAAVEEKPPQAVHT